MNKVKTTIENILSFRGLHLSVWLFIMLTLTSLPGAAVPEIKSVIGFDKILHGIGYFVLGILLQRYLIISKKYSFYKTFLIFFSFTILYAALDEFHQNFIPNRDCSVYDFLADICGVLTALILYQKVFIYLERALRSH